MFWLSTWSCATVGRLQPQCSYWQSPEKILWNWDSVVGKQKWANRNISICFFTKYSNLLSLFDDIVIFYSYLSDVDWQLPLTEVVEPVDFEEYVSSHAPGVEPGPLRQLMEFPQDDLELLPLDKECTTLEPPLPDEDEWVVPL